jgi:ribosomal protein S27E
MKIEEFEEYTRNHDDNIYKNEWDTIKFKIVCAKCGSKDTKILFHDKEVGHSEYTGVWTASEASILVKCIDCGNAIQIELDED